MRVFTLVGLTLIQACVQTHAPPPPAYLVYVRDYQGSVLAAIDDRGHQVWRQKQDSFGLRLASSGQPIPRGFLDQPFDEETGFYQFHYRTYDPATAQWLTPDPLLLEKPGQCMDQPQACNPYSYAANRPTEWLDPDGRWVDMHQVGTETYLNITAGVVGADAQRVADAMVAGMNRYLVGTHVHVSILVKVYDSVGEIPKSFTPVIVDPSLKRSEYDKASSTIRIGQDGLKSNFDQLARLTAHEVVGHGAGLGDKYFNFNGDSYSVPGHGEDIMGNFYKSSSPHFPPDMQKLLGHSLWPSNAGLQAPSSSESPPGAVISGEYPGGISIPPTAL
jgi:RHS repeat-associated protein